MSTPPPITQQVVAGNNRLWIILCHISPLIGLGLLLPLVVFLWKKTESEIVAEHAREALNFHLSLFLYGLACTPIFLLCFLIPIFFFALFLLVPAFIAIAVAGFVLSIIGTVKASENILYRYPLTLRLV